MTTSTSVETRPVLSRGRLRLLIAGLMTGMLLAALDQMIVSTAMPTIVRVFHGIAHYSWVVTAYLLASTASTPLYGKVSDLYGRRPVLLFAIGTFLLGSLLAGASPNMSWLIATRGLQGMGAGGLSTLAFTVISDVVSARERARYQGLFGLAYGVASVAGPLVGGYFAQHNWRWIFYVNLPVGAAAFVVCNHVLRHVPHKRRDHRIDWTGAFLLVVAVCCLLLALSWGGREYPWLSAQILGLFGAGLAVVVAFLVVEKRAAEPILPLRLFGRSTFTLAVAACFVFGFCMYGAVVFVQLYLQVAKGATPTRSGLLMVPLMGGLVVTSSLSGRLITRVGRYKWSPVAGALFLLAGVALLTRLYLHTPLWHAFAAMLVTGVGLGFGLQPLILAVQTALDPRELGAGTSAATFFRSMGAATGVSVLGAIMTNRLTVELAAAVRRLPAPARAAFAGKGTSVDELTAIGVPPGPVRDAVQASFVSALHPVFLTAAGVSVIAVLLTVALPNRALHGTAAAGRRRGGRHRLVRHAGSAQVVSRWPEGQPGGRATETGRHRRGSRVVRTGS